MDKTGLELIGIDKRYQTRTGVKHVLDDVNLKINNDTSIGILGINGAGKSTLIRLISGAEMPTKGTIVRKMSISWPLGFGGSFQGSLSGADNIKFICRIYKKDIRESIDYVQEFAELSKDIYEPVKNYSTGMLTRLAFGISLAVNFDCYLIDEIIAVGDSRFHKKCINEIFVKRKEKSKIIVSHQSEIIRAYCTESAVLHLGKLHHFKNVEEGLNFYTNENL